MQIGYIGLGKMGLAMTERLLTKGYDVVAYNRSPEPLAEAVSKGVKGSESLKDFVSKLTLPRVIWLMVTASAVKEVMGELGPLLAKGDLVIDGGNSFFQNSAERANTFSYAGLRFMDVGVSGGPGGAREGACLMVGGEREWFEQYKTLFTDLARPDGVAYCGLAGAGHFVKMVHNGIEYGMMQALGEGFALLQKSDFNFDLREIARIYNTGSVIESRLTNWLVEGYKQYGPELADISAVVDASGEGQWTVETAEAMNIPTPVITAALEFRKASKKRRPSYIGQVVSLLRHMFGQHDVSKK